MGCLEFRQRCGAEPDCELPAFTGHERECAACAAHARQLRELDASILQALRIPVRTPRRASPANLAGAPRRLLALAASLVLAVGLATGVWLSLPQEALASAVLGHVDHEREAWLASETPVAREVLEAVLDAGKASMPQSTGLVTFARTCPIRGKPVPHLVIQGQQGPIMLLLMPEEPVPAPVPLERPGYTGIIVPVSGGSIALVGVAGEPVRETAEEISRTVSWGDRPAG